MTTLAFNSLSKSTARSPLFASVQGVQAKKRLLHQSVTRQAIIMPAMSPFMTEGTITRWRKKEGEAFSAGDVLLQIQSDVATVDVEAESPGILGKILLPDGSTNVPIEKVIALVVKDDKELANLSARMQAQAPMTPPCNPVPSPGRPVTPSLPVDHQSQPFVPPAHRSPSLFELHSMGYSQHRGMMMKHAHKRSLSIVPPSPQTSTYMPSPSVLLSSSKLSTFHSRKAMETERTVDELDNQMDGVTIRRMIVSNLAQTPTSGASPLTPKVGKCETKAYFDGIL
jgi:pyruvate/2-oxoglutarate dehydrogenase complex dihydrolipoamide acyltransferase (E2) component